LGVSSPHFELKCPMTRSELAAIIEKSGESSLIGGLREIERAEALKRMTMYVEKYFGLCNKTATAVSLVEEANTNLTLPAQQKPEDCDTADGMENLKKTLSKPIMGLMMIRIVTRLRRDF